MDSVASKRQGYREHLSGYQRRDYEVVDYKMHELEGTRLRFRGPVPADFASGRYFTCIGAAQTFGCFCDQPFPELLATKLGIPALNLGYGGAGPEFFERHESLDKYINGGQFVIIQIMSGRSQSNSLFDCRGLEYTIRRSDGMALSADAAYGDLLFGIPALRNSPFGTATPLARKIFRRLLPKLILPRLLAAPKVRRVIDETRRGWVESYQRLLARIEVPVILLWFSKRQPAYVENLRDVGSLFGEFPQLVNSGMVEKIRPLSDHYVECVTKRGSPQLLKSRFTSEQITVNPALDRPDLAGAKPWTHNLYYPSPEMHEDAANALFAASAALANQRHAT